MLVSELVASVRARLRQRGESSAFDDTAIIDYINEKLLEVSDALEYTRTVVVLTPDSLSRVYLPTDCLRIEYVGRNGIEIYPLTPKETALLNTDINSSLGGWYGYLFVNGYLQLGSTENITLNYIAKLPKIDNVNQDMNYREEYRMPIIDGTVYQCFLELGQMDKAAHYEAKYKEQLRDRRETIRGNAFKTRKYPSLAPVEV